MPQRNIEKLNEKRESTLDTILKLSALIHESTKADDAFHIEQQLEYVNREIKNYLHILTWEGE